MPQPTTTVTSPKSRGVVPRVNSPQPRVTGHNAQSRVTLPPCETDRSSGRSNPPKKNQFSQPNSSSTGKGFSPLAEAVPAVAAAALHARSAAAARAPATPANLISRRIRRNCGHLRHPLGAADHGNTTLGSNAHTISACGRNPSALHYPVHPPPATTISKRPARLRRRPFGVPSPCRKNEQENCRFIWDWRPRRPPAFSPATGKLPRAPITQHNTKRAPSRAQPHPNHPPPISPYPPPLPLISLKRLTAAPALLARRKHPGARC